MSRRTNRIAAAYAARFRSLLERIGARRLDKGVEILLARANTPETARANLRTRTLVRLHARLRDRVEAWEARDRGNPSSASSAVPVPQRFWCDAGLGGLARWLRAAGYETFWEPNIPDDRLLNEACVHQATLLSTDSLLFERKHLRDGVQPGLWIPPTLTVPEQLELVLREWHLPILETSRCMRCGGKLAPAEKETVWDSIPPKTRLWRDQFWTCARCGKLYWHGTHWQRIRTRLLSLPG